MKLLIGLGNPGKQYENTRHNTGFIVLDKLREKWKFPAFAYNKKFDAEISESASMVAGLPLGSSTPEAERVILVKPQSFMNRSGQVVRAIMNFYKLSPEDIVVIHDDLDINLGTMKISANSSAAGHNGVQSIIDILGTPQFKRLRIGIEGIERKKNRLIPGEKFVLQDFSEEEIGVIMSVIDTIKPDICK